MLRAVQQRLCELDGSSFALCRDSELLPQKAQVDGIASLHLGLLALAILVASQELHDLAPAGFRTDGLARRLVLQRGNGLVGPICVVLPVELFQDRGVRFWRDGVAGAVSNIRLIPCSRVTILPRMSRVGRLARDALHRVA